MLKSRARVLLLKIKKANNMVLFIGNQRKQKYLIWIFIAVLSVTGAVVYFGFLKDKIKIFEISIPYFGASHTDVILRDINIDFGILESKDVKNLSPFEAVSDFKGSIGREDPFKPSF